LSVPKLPAGFVKLCKAVTAKRAKTVIMHILRHGSVTSEVLRDKYKYDHPPRAVQDVKDLGIPIKKVSTPGKQGRPIARYSFGDPAKTRMDQLLGRSALGKQLKQKLILTQGARCAIYMQPFPERDLQIDHRVPFQVAGDSQTRKPNPKNFMLVCASANRAKSWSCEHCVNWLELKKPDICRSCYWAFPDNYTHIAMRQIRRADIMWTEKEVEVYEKLKQRTLQLQKNIPGYVKEIVEEHLKTKP